MALRNLNRKINRMDKLYSSNKKSRFSNLAIKLVILLLIIFVVLYLPLRGIYQSSRQLMQNSRVLAASVKQENLDQTKKALSDTRSSVKSLNQALNFIFWLRFIPFAGDYYQDAKHFAKAADYELEAAQIITDSLMPYKDELGLTGQVTAGQDRVVQATKVLNKILPNIDKFASSLKKARQEVEVVDTGKYPASFGSTPVRSRLEQAKGMIIGLDVVFTENKDLLENAPAALGEPSAKTYLLLFQNDKELRPTGGFITAFAFLKLDRGRVSTTASDDIYRLDEKLLKVCQSRICPLTPPAPIVKYLPELTGKPRTAWAMRDSNLSPDLPTAVSEFERMYQLLGEGLPFDGIIMIDTHVVEDLIALTGPIDVFGTKYSAETDKRCNCPNVIYELEHYAEIASKGEEDRKAVLGTLMQQIMARSLGAGPDRLPDFLNTGVKLANEKHIMFYFHDLKLQKSFSRLNWTGQILDSQGDYLHINDANFAGGKSNLYVDEKVTFEISVGKEGSVKNKVTIEYKNPQPFNIWLNGILRDYVRLYAPLGSKLINSKGSDDPVQTQTDDELNKTFFEAFITVRPQNSRTLSFEYSLPNKFSGKEYPLLIQKQPGAKDHHYIVKLNGKTKAEFDLISDKQLNLSF